MAKRMTKVGTKTLLHHIKSPWLVDLKQQGYYFCTDPQCQVVYFGQDDSVIQVSDVKSRVGQKETKQDRPICYCFDVTQLNAEKDASIKSFVVNKTKAALCSCETSNPFRKVLSERFPLKPLVYGCCISSRSALSVLVDSVILVVSGIFLFVPF